LKTIAIYPDGEASMLLPNSDICLTSYTSSGTKNNQDCYIF